MLAQRGIHNKLGETSGYIRQMRYKLANGISISTDTKLRLLQKTGWQQDDKIYSQKDLVALAKFTLKQTAARELGAEYIVEKFLLKK